MRALDPEMVEHGEDVGGGAGLAVGGGIGRHVRRRIAARAIADGAIGTTEIAHLVVPTAVIAGELMHEDQWRAAAGLLVVEFHDIVGHGKRHRLRPGFLRV